MNYLLLIYNVFASVMTVRVLMYTIYYSVLHNRLLIIMGALHYGWFIYLCLWNVYLGTVISGTILSVCLCKET